MNVAKISQGMQAQDKARNAISRLDQAVAPEEVARKATGVLAGSPFGA